MKFWNWSKDRQLESALKLQELVKEWIKKLESEHQDDNQYRTHKELQSLVDESEK